MYVGRVACCPLVSHGREYAGGTDERDTRPLHYAFRCGRSKRSDDVRFLNHCPIGLSG